VDWKTKSTEYLQMLIKESFKRELLPNSEQKADKMYVALLLTM
jgi:hypothetical protein